MDDYESAAAALRVPISGDPSPLNLVRFATLAANGHNTQPWLFSVEPSAITILPDLKRQTAVVDPDDHHLYASLGCAAENLSIAAAAHGRPSEMTYQPGGHGAIQVDLGAGSANRSELYEAIPKRQSTRSVYDGRKVPAEDLRKLEAAAATEDVNLTLITDESRMAQVRDFVVAGNSAQMDDPAFVQELKDWIRFNPASALYTRDGLFSACSGNPTIPAWFGRMMFGRFFTKDGENEKYVEHIKSSAGIAIFTGAREDREHWVKVGRSFQRFALQATALGIRHAHINQPIEVPSIRTEFASWLGAPDARPDLVVRFGYAPALPMSMRRSATSVVV